MLAAKSSEITVQRKVEELQDGLSDNQIKKPSQAQQPMLKDSNASVVPH